MDVGHPAGQFEKLCFFGAFAANNQAEVLVADVSNTFDDMLQSLFDAQVSRINGQETLLFNPVFPAKGTLGGLYRRIGAVGKENQLISGNPPFGEKLCHSAGDDRNSPSAAIA